MFFNLYYSNFYIYAKLKYKMKKPIYSLKNTFLISALLLILTFGCSKDTTDELPNSAPTIQTNGVLNITSTSATCGGTITSDGGGAITARGIIWSTSRTPNILLPTKTSDGTGTGTFVSQMTGLTLGTTYYVRAYCTNSFGTTYGNEISFVLQPTLITTAISSITGATATGGGNVLADLGAPITARGIVWSTTSNPTIALSTKTTDGNGLGVFSSSLTNLIFGATYYVRAYATNSAGTTYGNEVTFVAIPTIVLSTSAVTAVLQTTATSGGTITFDGGAAITASGIVWNTAPNPTTALTTKTADGITSLGNFSSNLTGLIASTTYYVRAYATNTYGVFYGNEIMFTTADIPPYKSMALCDPTHQTPIVPVTSITGKVWMDRNLGASRAALSATDFEAYGCLFQWGRGNDGHASAAWTSGTAGTAVNASTNVTSNVDTPASNLFITNGSGNYDWRSPKNNNLWQGANGTNNPCPAGYKVPSEAELNAEFSAYNINSTSSAFAAPQKFVLSGFRDSVNAQFYDQGSYGYYWTSTASGNYSSFKSVSSSSNGTGSFSYYRAAGFPVRCMKE